MRLARRITNAAVFTVEGFALKVAHQLKLALISNACKN